MAVQGAEMRVLKRGLSAVLGRLWTGESFLQAGPPFFTDDPEPVEYTHWEFYLATQSSFTRSSAEGTAPHFEVNYGLLPGLQIHAIAPFAYIRDEEHSYEWGYGNTELGFKFRMVHESDITPQIGIFPLVELPTADHDLQMSDRIQVFIPLWLQKSLGKWTTYGGGGYWYNPGPDNRNWWFAGWLLQREITGMVSLGCEFFYATPDTVDASSRLGFNAGAIIYFIDTFHFIFSGGRDIVGDDIFFYYAAFLMTM